MNSPHLNSPMKFFILLQRRVQTATHNDLQLQATPGVKPSSEVESGF